MTTFEEPMVVQLDDIRVWWIDDEDEMGFKFTKELTTFSLTTKSQSVFMKWQAALRPRVFLSDFKEKYQKLEVLSES